MVEIYGLFDPDSGELRYIGKANNAQKRLKTHLTERHLKRPVCRWINSLVTKGKLPALVVLETVEKSLWEDTERRLIAEHRKTSRLLNLADGGARPSQTPEQRQNAARASNKAQALDPQRAALNKWKFRMGHLYKELSRKPSYNTYYLRLHMKCLAADRPDLYGCWANL